MMRRILGRPHQLGFEAGRHGEPVPVEKRT
jgi:hypothetical protein